MTPSRILIVDDKEENRYLLRALLQGHGYEVEEASHGGTALELARQSPPDLVIADILMPTMDGFALCREWQRDERLAPIPLIFYTATYTDAKDRDFAIGLGATRFIAKPAEPEVVLAIVQEVLALPRQRQASAPPDQVGATAADEAAYLRQYNQALVRKLEAKMTQLEEANRELRQDILRREEAAHERERLQTQLFQAQKLESIGRLAGGVAHDFNNMLSVIIGGTELASRDAGLTPATQAHLHAVLKAAERSANLTRQLLAFARRQPIAPRVLDLNEMVESMLKILRRLIGEHLELIWQPAPGLWPVKLDPSQIDQLLANLCVNARDAIADSCNAPGRVTITTHNARVSATECAQYAEARPGEYVCLSVRDTGSGMSPETLRRVFEPFFTTKAPGEGTGLGLATVEGIVKQNAGFIDVTSELGHGSRFAIYLPRAENVESATPASTGEAAPRGRGETILLVEDEAALLKLAPAVLEHLGYQVIAAPTPEQAIAIVQGQPGHLDLLLTDVIMPGMNGRELAERLRRLHPHLRCLFVSGYPADVIARQGVLADNLYFLQKPFSMETLAAKVAEVLAAPAP